jgi:hypothetical protein
MTEQHCLAADLNILLSFHKYQINKLLNILQIIKGGLAVN